MYVFSPNAEPSNRCGNIAEALYLLTVLMTDKSVTCVCGSVLLKMMGTAVSFTQLMASESVQSNSSLSLWSRCHTRAWLWKTAAEDFHFL